MIEKRFHYNVNQNIIEENGKFVAYMNCVDGVKIANKLNMLQKENEQLKSEINMLKTTIGRNEEYIYRLTHTGEWR